MSYEPQRFDFSIPVRVNLYSDTQTKPSRGMKQAMLDAEVGDEQAGLRSQRLGAVRSGGGVAGQGGGGVPAVRARCATRWRSPRIAVRATRSWRTRSAHIITSEAGAPGRDRRRLDQGPAQATAASSPPPTVEEAIRPRNRNNPPQTLLEVEQTANRGGGACWSVEGLRAVTEAAHKHGHCDAHGRRSAAECRGGAGRERDAS